MNKHSGLIYLAAALFASTSLFAQAPVSGYSPSKGGGDVATSGLFESQTGLEGQKRIFDTDSDSLDFEEGTLNWKGRSFNVANNRAVRARFERYLAAPALEDNEKEYQQILDDVIDKLKLVDDQLETKTKEQLDTEIFEAWKMLFKAGDYSLDNGTSLLVANTVSTAWRVRQEFARSEDAQALLNEKREGLRDSLQYEAWLRAKKFDDVQEKVAKGEHTGVLGEQVDFKIDSSVEGIQSSVTDRTMKLTDLAEVRAQMAALEAQTVASGLELKLQFQSQILQFILQRRFQHAIIAANFYRQIFKGSQQGLEVGEAQLEELFPKSDFNPTVDSLEFLAREAMNDAKTGMAAVDNAYENSELFLATERLQETFFLGEYLPEIIQYPEEKKANILEIFRKSREIQRLMDLKDYAKVNELTEEANELASDYPASAIVSLAQTAMQASNLAVLKAQQSISMGEISKAEQALKEATQIWPLNPAIKNFSETMAMKADLSTQAAMLFDELFANDNYRAIYKKKTEFGAALMQDPTRGERLKEVLETIGKVDMLAQSAQNMLDQNNSYAALEYLRAALEVRPNDQVANTLWGKVVASAPIFARHLNNAEDYENQGDYAVSLNEYLQAKDIYPVSKYASDGIKRVSAKLMKELTEEAKTTEPQDEQTEAAASGTAESES